MNKKTDNILLLIRLICSVGVLVFALLQIFGVWDKANFVVFPLLAASLVIQTFQEWKVRRTLAIFLLITTVFVVGCTFAVFFL